MADVRKTLPPDVNDVDMSWDGKRHAILGHYGLSSKDCTQQAAIDSVCKAWGVIDRFDIDVSNTCKKGYVDRSSSRSFMLLFNDGLWRRASFGGLNGQPCASCDWKGYQAATGELAYLEMRIAWEACELKTVESVMARIKKDLQELLEKRESLQLEEAKCSVSEET